MRKFLAIGFLLLFARGVAFGSGMIGGGGINLSGTTDNQVMLWDNAIRQWYVGGIEGVGGPTGATGATGATGPAGDNGATGATGDATADNVVQPRMLSTTGTPDNTMYPRWVNDNTFEWTTPAGGGSPAWGDITGKPSRNFSLVFPDLSVLDNLAISPWPSTVTITGIGGTFSAGATISEIASDNVTMQFLFCAPDNVASCTSIDNVTITGGTAVFQDNTIGGTAAVPARSVLQVFISDVNNINEKIFSLFLTYTEN